MFYKSGFGMPDFLIIVHWYVCHLRTFILKYLELLAETKGPKARCL